MHTPWPLDGGEQRPGHLAFFWDVAEEQLHFQSFLWSIAVNFCCPVWPLTSSYLLWVAMCLSKLSCIQSLTWSWFPRKSRHTTFSIFFFFSPEHFSLVILFSISFVYRVIRYFGFLWTVLFYVPVGMVTHLTGIPFHFQKGPGLGHKLCDHPTNLSHFYTYYIFTRC